LFSILPDLNNKKLPNISNACFTFTIFDFMLTGDEQKAQLKGTSVYIETIHTETPPCALEGPSNWKTNKIDRKKFKKTCTCLAQD
jgi:hypothetical protein